VKEELQAELKLLCEEALMQFLATRSFWLKRSWVHLCWGWCLCMTSG
jgi:hypothetical protein